jgi:hypothetical protein
VTWVEALVNVGIGLITGTLAGIVASALWARREDRRWRERCKRLFGHLAGHYRMTTKVEKRVLQQTAVVEVVGNILHVQWEGMREGDWVDGSIEMREDFPRRGTGLYTHMSSGMLLGGDWEVQTVSPGRLFVRRTYTSHKTLSEITQDYIWDRITAASDSADMSETAPSEAAVNPVA